MGSHPVTLGEGGTPLIASSREPWLRFKLESANPTGSYKDRFAVGELRRMLDAGQRACIATSSGNTGSALAACAARYDVACTIVVNEFAPAGKLVQMQAHGARVIRVPGFTVDAAVTAAIMDLLAEFARARNVAMVVSAYRYCTCGMANVENIGREIIAEIPEPVIFVPVGGGGLCTAVCRGVAGSGARVFAVQPEGCNTVAAAWEADRDTIVPVASTTRISGLAVPYDIDAARAVSALRENGGRALTVTDDEVFNAQREMLAREGIYAEPAGATALAGARKALRAGWISERDTAVCLVTGHGFKDPDSVSRAAALHPDRRVDPDRLRSVLWAEAE